VSDERPREPIFNAPWPALLLAASLPALYFLQRLVPDQNALEDAYGLSVPGIAAGRYVQLLSSQFLHGSWSHVLMNALFSLAFGVPVARLLGVKVRGALAYFGFFIFCGVIAGLGFLLLNLGSNENVIGASGAASGLFGAASRLLNRERRLGPLLSPTVIACTAAYVVLNVLIGLTNFNFGAEGMQVAWQAHLFGFAAGLLLIGPWASVFGERGREQASPQAFDNGFFGPSPPPPPPPPSDGGTKGPWSHRD
jgi:membrane associated rhomboid family serine protease